MPGILANRVIRLPGASKRRYIDRWRELIKLREKQKSRSIDPSTRLSYDVIGQTVMHIASRLTLVGCCVLMVNGCNTNHGDSTIRTETTVDANTKDVTALPQKMFAGEIEITNLPPHFGLTVSLALFPVSGPGAPAPYNGDPPGDMVADCPELYNQVKLDAEIQRPTRTIPFSIKRPAGYYYLQLRTLLYRKQDEKVFAQAEQFFFGRRPLTLLDDLSSVKLPVEWPSIPLDELDRYGAIEPQKGR